MIFSDLEGRKWKINTRSTLQFIVIISYLCSELKPYFKVLIPLPHSEQFIVAKNVKKKKKVTEVSSNYENNTNDTVKKSRTLQKGKKHVGMITKFIVMIAVMMQWMCSYTRTYQMIYLYMRSLLNVS